MVWSMNLVVGFIIVVHMMTIQKTSFCCGEKIMHQVVFSKIDNCSSLSTDLSGRNKRSLIFPSGAIMQLSLGIGINPNVDGGTININFGFQQNVPLPTNLTLLRSPPGAKGFSSLELYSFLEQTLERYGMNGHECIKKSICQMSLSTFNAVNTLEEVIQFILSPVLHSSISDNNMEPYHNATESGYRLGNCDQVYPLCQFSLLDMITHKY